MSAQHQFGFVKHPDNPALYDVYQGRKDGESPLIGRVVYDRKTNKYTAFTLDGKRLEFGSGRAKHFCTRVDAARELVSCQS